MPRHFSFSRDILNMSCQKGIVRLGNIYTMELQSLYSKAALPGTKSVIYDMLLNLLKPVFPYMQYDDLPHKTV